MATRRFLAFYVGLWSLAAHGSPQKAQEWLKAIDQATSPFEDAHIQMSIQVQKGADSSRVVQRDIEIWQRGAKERRVRMRSPARLSGVGLLVSEDGSLHSYLPAYRRSRRVVGEQRGDAFMGTDFSMEDLSRLGFSEEFHAKTLEENEESILLELNAIDPSTHRFPVLHLLVNRVNLIPRAIEYLDNEGRIHRRLSLEEVQEVGGHPFAHRIRLEDLERSRVCTAIVESIVVNQGLPDRLFQVSNLHR